MANNQKMQNYMKDDFVLNMSEVTRIIKSTLPEGLTGQQKKQKIEFEKQKVKDAMDAENDLQCLLALFGDRPVGQTEAGPHETCSFALAKGINQYFLDHAQSDANHFGRTARVCNHIDFIWSLNLNKTPFDEKAPQSAIITQAVIAPFGEHARQIGVCINDLGDWGKAHARELERDFSVTSIDACRYVGKSYLNNNFKLYAQQFGVPEAELKTMCNPLYQIFLNDWEKQNKARKEADDMLSMARMSGWGAFDDE